MVKISDFYFIWLSIIDSLTYEIYLRLIEVFKDEYSLYESTKDKSKFKKELHSKGCFVPYCIFISLLDDNIKNESIAIYENLTCQNINILTIKSNKYPKLLKRMKNPPFCLIYYGEIDFNKRYCYIYYETYFTNFASNLVNYFAKIVCELCSDLIITEKELSINKYIKISMDNTFSKDFKVQENKNCIFVQNNEVRANILSFITHSLIIIEARYDKYIVSLVNELLDEGKDIYVIPSNIYRKNSYFSNYLIKEGANILLNKNDIISIFK